jgi:hypothetical protein
MLEENNLLISDLQEDEKEENILNNSNINKMQMNLEMMGFNIEMINKIITFLK